MKTFTTQHRQHASGFTLVEALVALVVLSIGMLGIAGLYVESLRAGRTALVRSEAVNLAGDMADRIRANRMGGVNYAKAINDPGALDANCEEGGASASCTPAIMAGHDKAIWDTEVARLLPGGTSQIQYTNANPDQYVITVSWVEVGQDTPVSLVMRIEA